MIILLVSMCAEFVSVLEIMDNTATLISWGTHAVSGMQGRAKQRINSGNKRNAIEKFQSRGLRPHSGWVLHLYSRSMTRSDCRLYNCHVLPGSQSELGAAESNSVQSRGGRELACGTRTRTINSSGRGVVY